MRIFIALLMALYLALPTPLAEAADAAGSSRSAQQNPPLKPGRSAGVRAAQLPRTGLALVGASAIIAVVVVAVGTSSGSNGSQPNLQSAPTTTTP